MKVLFAVSNENISNSIVKQYQQDFKEIISYKNVYYFNAILKEIQKDKSYDIIVISEDLEPFANKNYDVIDKFLFEKLDSISDEATDSQGNDISIILICTDRRTKSDSILTKLFGIGVYSALMGQDRSIEEVCKLIQKPRNKKEAKVYYNLETEDVNYSSESNNNVSEVEIQNILSHYRRLGKNEEKYVESFYNIAEQYSDNQLRIIIKFLPINIKLVLEQNCPKYQEITAFVGKQNNKHVNANSLSVKEKFNKTTNVDPESLKVDVLENNLSRLRSTRPIIIPGEQIQEEDDDDNEEVKKTRGRPKKAPEEVSEIEIAIPKRRGRPKKIEEQEINLFDMNDQENEEKTEIESITEPIIIEKEVRKETIDTNYVLSEYTNLKSLLTKNKKISAFVGSTKNGTSFIVNNLAEHLSTLGIKVAILDVTENKNSYYIYTKNQENLRKIAYESIINLERGKAEGIQVNKNLTVYTALPTDNRQVEDYERILATLIQNNSIVLIDCDFKTNLNYFSNAQEIYLVQSLDILTIQPFTLFLRDLKTKGILEQNKLRVIINKEIKGKGLTAKNIIGGLAFYNDPAMTFMTELFDRNTINYFLVPFEIQNYIKYLEGVVDCTISLTGYSKTLIGALKEIGDFLYEIDYKYAPKQTANITNKFSNTLEKMKNKY